MRVLLVTYALGDWISGGTLYNRRVVRALNARGACAEILALRRPPALRAALQRPEPRLERALSGAGGYDAVVVDAIAHPTVANPARGRASSPRLVTLVHMLRNAAGRTPHPLASALERRLLRASDLVITVSEAARSAVAALAGGIPVAVCAPGCDGAAGPGGPGAMLRRSAAPLLLSVGNLFRVKGQDLLLRALAPHAALPWRLRLVGDLGVEPAFTRRVRRLIRRLRLESRVELAGSARVEELREAYLSADLFVLPSRYEAYGIALAEAISFGLPVVGFDVGGAREVAGREDLVRARDVRAFGERVAALLADGTLREAAARRSRERAATLSTWAETAERFAALLEGVVAGGGAGSPR